MSGAGEHLGYGQGYGYGGLPYAVAHRGGGGLALENTLAAFAYSYALGYRHLETDLQTTSDGVCAALHDATLRRLAGLPIRIRDVTWCELAGLRLAGGHRVRLHRLPVFVERLVTMAHDLGAQLLVWTVDEPAWMHRLLDLGIDGIITDRPDLLRDVLAGRGCWVAPAGGLGLGPCAA
jgi:glycerophosphoryl diester phosphodiesterase